MSVSTSSQQRCEYRRAKKYFTATGCTTTLPGGDCFDRFFAAARAMKATPSSSACR